MTVAALTAYRCCEQLLGSLSKLPAIKTFCVYAAAAICLTFLFMSSGFAAMLALDARRQDARRYDCFACVESKAEVAAAAASAKPAALQRFMAGYARVLLKPPVKALVLVVFGAVLGLSSWGWTKTTSGFDLIDLTPDDSCELHLPPSSPEVRLSALVFADVRDFFDLNEQLLGTQAGKVPFGVYTKDLAYHEAGVQADYLALHQTLNSSALVDADVDSWYLSFQRFLSTSAAFSASLDSDGRLTAAASFYPAVQSWLEFEVGGVRVYGRYADDVIWSDASDPTQGIRAARFTASHPIARSRDSEGQSEYQVGPSGWGIVRL